MFNSENKETVTIIFAVDANHDLYKVARFTEKIYNKQRYCWSHLGNLVYCAEQSGDDAPVKRDENYFEPITRYELMYYFRNPNESEFYRVSEMLKRSGFDKKAVAFYMLIITVDCDTNKEQHHMYFITKCDLGVEYVFRKPVEKVSVGRDNTEFYAYGETYHNNKKIYTRRKHQFAGTWSDEYYLDGPRIDENALFEELHLQAITLSGSYDSVPPEEISFVSWTYADDKHFKLTQDGIKYLEIHNTKSNKL